MNTAAGVISVVFHPLLMATYLFSLLAFALPVALSPVQSGSHWYFVLMVFIVTFVLPMLCVGIFRTLGTIDSLMMKNRKERVMPFIFISVIYIAVTGMFYSQVQLSLDTNFIRLLMIIDMLVVVATVLTFFFKVSVHSIGIWGLIGIVIPLSQLAEVNSMLYISAGLIVAAGLVMASRLQLGAHSAREVMWGSIAGLGTSVVGMLVVF